MRIDDLAHWTHRMLQALDIYWLHYDPPRRMDRVRSESTVEDWWIRFEKYRGRVESLIKEMR